VDFEARCLSGSRVASVPDSGTEGPGFKSQRRRCLVADGPRSGKFAGRQVFVAAVSAGPAAAAAGTAAGCPVSDDADAVTWPTVDAQRLTKTRRQQGALAPPSGVHAVICKQANKWLKY